MPNSAAKTHHMIDLAQVRERYRAGKTSLFESLAASGSSTRGIRKVLQKLTRHTDATLQLLWEIAGFPTDACLVAAGGFGRGELFPHSDVDVVLLLPDNTLAEGDPALTAKIESFISNCWDSGLEIGSSVRTVVECVEEASKDVTVQTSLLEARLVAGHKKNFARLTKQLAAVMDPKAFFIAKTLELQQRHNKFENTPYSLEPNCKESPGGLRDLQVILWVAKAAGLGKSWDELARCGLATAFEVRQIKANEALLYLIRARLHIITGRREDRLVFDLQTAVAESFGYVAPTSGAARSMDGTFPTAQEFGAVSPKDGLSVKRVVHRTPSRPSEALMRRYYWAAKAVTQLNQILLLNIEERLNPNHYLPRPINERFLDKAGMLEVASDDLYEREPHAILETFLLYETTIGIRGLTARTQYRAGHLIAINELLTQNVGIKLRCLFNCGCQLRWCCDFGQTNRRAFTRGLDDQRQAQLGQRSSHIRIVISPAPEQHMLWRGQTFCRQHALGHHLVNCNAGRHHTRTGVRYAEQFKRALDGTVFTEAAMQSDEAAVKAFFFELPQVALSGVKRMSIHAARQQCGQHTVARHERNLALG